MAKTKIFAMEKVSPKSDVKIINSLKVYLRAKAELKNMEDEVKEMERRVFQNPDRLPEEIEVDGVNYKKQTRLPSIGVTNKMIEDAGLDLERIMPLASFSMTLVETVYGKSGKSSVSSTDAYNDELAMKTISIFYRKK